MKMIRLSNGHEFKYMVASGALGFGGKGWLWERPLRRMGLIDPSLFTVVIKTLTYESRKGNLRWYNPLGCIRPMWGGVVNAVGLTNPGIDWWCENIGPFIDLGGISLVGSILSDDIDELVDMAIMLDKFKLVALEINASCPNTTEGDLLKNTQKIIDACHAVKKETNLPLILKLSVVHDVIPIINGVSDVVEAISINSVPWNVIFPNKISPLKHLGGGGVSGKIAQEHTWRLVRKIVMMHSIDVVAPSIWDYEDIERARRLGAKAISFASVFLPYPCRPTSYVKRDMKIQKGKTK